MREVEDKLVDDAVDADGTADDLHSRVGRVLVDEVVTVKVCQVLAANTASCLHNSSALTPWYLKTNKKDDRAEGSLYCRNIINIWLLHHRPHGLGHGPLHEFEIRVFVPYRFKIEGRAEFRLQKREAACMRHACCSVLEIRVAR